MKKTMRILVLLLLCDLLLILAHILLKHTLGFFDLDKEGSAKAIFSGMQLIAMSVAAGSLACLSRHAYSKTRRAALWALTATVFFFLAFEDMMAVHERVGFVFNRWTNWHGAYESFNWLIYYAPFIFLGAFVLAQCTRRLFVFGRTIGMLALCGYAGLLGSVLAEYVGSQLLRAGAIPWYHVSIIFEEGLLLVGESFFLTALLGATRVLFEKVYEKKSLSLMYNRWTG